MSRLMDKLFPLGPDGIRHLTILSSILLALSVFGATTVANVVLFGWPLLRALVTFGINTCVATTILLLWAKINWNKTRKQETQKSKKSRSR